MISFAHTESLTFLLCIASVFTSQIPAFDFKHVRSSSTAADIHLTTETKQSTSETKVKSTHTEFAFVLSGSEPFSIHQINLRYIIYKAAMLVHSQNKIRRKRKTDNVKNTTLHKHTAVSHP